MKKNRVRKGKINVDVDGNILLKMEKNTENTPKETTAKSNGLVSFLGWILFLAVLIVVGGAGAIEIVESAATILASIHQYNNVLVGHRSSNIVD